MAIQASVFKKGESCYEIKLVGSMIDTLACKNTAVNYRQVDCKTKAGAKFNKVFSRLKNCDSKKVTGALNTKDGEVEWVALNQSSAGFDIWTLQEPGISVVASVAAAPAAPVKVEKKAVDSEVSKGVDPLFGASNPQLTSKWNLDASWKAGLLSNHPVNVRDVSIYKSQISFAGLNIGYLLNPIQDFQAKFTLSTSPNLPSYLSSPFGVTSTAYINFTEAFLQNLRSETFKIKLGWYQSPLVFDDGVAFDYKFGSRSMATSHMTPHLFSGVSLINDWNERLNSEVFLINGWNETASINERVSYGFVLKHQTEALGARLGVYLGDEGLPTNLVKVTLYKISIVWQKMLDFQLLSGSLNTGEKFNSYILQANYQLSDKRKLGLRIENYSNTDAFLLSSEGWVSGNALSLGVNEQFNNIVNGHIELEYDQPTSVANTNISTKAQQLVLFGVDIKL